MGHTSTSSSAGDCGHYHRGNHLLLLSQEKEATKWAPTCITDASVVFWFCFLLRTALCPPPGGPMENEMVSVAKGKEQDLQMSSKDQTFIYTGWLWTRLLWTLSPPTLLCYPLSLSYTTCVWNTWYLWCSHQCTINPPQMIISPPYYLLITENPYYHLKLLTCSITCFCMCE